MASQRYSNLLAIGSGRFTLCPFRPHKIDARPLDRSHDGGLVSRVNIIDFGPISGFETPHFKIEPECDIREFLTRYAKYGEHHHSALCLGDAQSRLKMVADMLNAEYLEI